MVVSRVDALFLLFTRVPVFVSCATQVTRVTSLPLASSWEARLLDACPMIVLCGKMVVDFHVPRLLRASHFFTGSPSLLSLFLHAEETWYKGGFYPLPPPPSS